MVYYYIIEYELQLEEAKEKHLEMSDWNLLCLRRITADCSVCLNFLSVENKINHPTLCQEVWLALCK